MLDLSAAIVTYNSSFDKLQRCIDTFKQCTLRQYILIHDNTSRPEYRERLGSLNTKIIDGPNRGFAFGHNRAIQQCPASRYHLILNPDVEIPPGSLEKMTAYMDSHPEIGLMVPKITYPNGDLQPLNKQDPSFFDLFFRRFLPTFIQNWSPIKKKMQKYIMMDKGYEKSYEVPYMSGCFMLFRRSVYEEIGGFDENFFMYLEDADITRKARSVSKCLYFSEATIIHHWERGSHKQLKLTWISIKSSFYYFCKWGWKFF